MLTILANTYLMLYRRWNADKITDVTIHTMRFPYDYYNELNGQLGVINFATISKEFPMQTCFGIHTRICQKQKAPIHTELFISVRLSVLSQKVFPDGAFLRRRKQLSSSGTQWDHPSHPHPRWALQPGLQTVVGLRANSTSTADPHTPVHTPTHTFCEGKPGLL